jgi:hypothetical protein
MGTLLSLPIVAMYYDVHTLLGIEARTVVLVDTAIAHHLTTDNKDFV